MDHVRGLAVPLGAAVLASLTCTTVWRLADPGFLHAGEVAIVGWVTLLFTMAGSAALTLLFALTGPWPVALRYVLLLIFGPVTGALVFLGVPALAAIGAAYGAATSCFWVGLHWAIYRGR